MHIGHPIDLHTKQMARYSHETYLKQWRQRQVRISQGAAMAYRFVEVLSHSDGCSEDTTQSFLQMLQHAGAEFKAGVHESCTEDDKAYKLSYLRNFTFAYYLASSRQKQSYEEFLEYFTFRLWSNGDAILRDAIGEDTCNAELKEAAKMDRYMQLMVHIYCNQLLNLAQDSNLPVVDDEQLLSEFKILHMEFEDKKFFDEIAVIRWQLMYSVAADVADMWSDEARQRVFLVDAYDLLNQFNTKAMQVDMAR